ncbi:unnamed protein product [Macrosiphum euphorbiae]|uniref:Uncharacterized protein n=1 Tax=Macrosiphum euphorbiae TaxID=13131 RepID=A0AAV0W749_9HEMI|nr:unnamed protein product [Macrosiphum euphorbiae]
MLLGRFLGRADTALVEVRVVKEPGEQQQVTEVHGRRQGDVELGHTARVRAAGLQVTVSGVVDEAADQHLRQLTGSDEHGHLLGRSVAHGPRSVIRVHHRVYRVVHDDEPPGGRRELHVREPRVQQHGDVMIPVQEDERLLAEHDEYRVTEFGQLGQHEQPRPEPRHRVILNVAASGKTK